jgi:predicted small lipoprotein YifL
LPAFKGFLLVLAGVMVAVALSGCGRKGGLDLPPSATAVPPTAPTAASVDPNDPNAATVEARQAAIKNGFDARGNPVGPPGQNRPFFLDPLLQ